MVCAHSRNTYKAQSIILPRPLNNPKNIMLNPENTIIIIPARMASTRLPGKPMADIHGAPMIVHVWRRAMEAGIGHVLVAAAETPIAQAIWDQGGDAILTEPRLPSGSDRVMAALSLRDPDRKFDHVINLQGDLPTIAPESIRQCHAALIKSKSDIATLACRIYTDAEVKNPNIVKAIAQFSFNEDIANATDFLRTVPNAYLPPFYHHIGVYAYEREALERFVTLPTSWREQQRSLEQMRALDNGMTISVARVTSNPLGVDTRDELDEARRLLKTT
jgi:3-deoxy-manno-octulosonate cytidylyltransferase (CMP-KDO synthetase)